MSDLSIAPGWKAGGFAAWNLTGPGQMNCRACGRVMELLLKIDSYELRDGASWRPVGEGPDCPREPTGVVVGNWGKLNIFACPADPSHPHHFSVQ